MHTVVELVGSERQETPHVDPKPQAHMIAPGIHRRYKWQGDIRNLDPTEKKEPRHLFCLISVDCILNQIAKDQEKELPNHH